MTFRYSEARLAKNLPMVRSELRNLRELHLQEDVDWKKNDFGAVLLSLSGLKRIEKLAELHLPDDLTQFELQEKNGEGEMMTVAVRCINTRMLEADDEEGVRWLIDVGNNRAFALGDEILVGPHHQQGVKMLLSALPRDSRRPAYYGSLRDPGADWGAKESHAMWLKEQQARRQKPLH
jgi:hypothetical protein